MYSVYQNMYLVNFSISFGRPKTKFNKYDCTIQTALWEVIGLENTNIIYQIINNVLQLNPKASKWKLQEIPGITWSLS